MTVIVHVFHGTKTAFVKVINVIIFTFNTAAANWAAPVFSALSHAFNVFSPLMLRFAVHLV